MPDYDDTDRGATFPPKDQQLILQGKINSKGEDYNVVLVRGVTRAGDPIIGVYQRVGALFPNDKGDNESRPDYTGPINFDSGPKRYLSAWKKMKDDMPYMSISIQDPGSGSRTQAAEPDTDVDDNIPF